MARNKNTYVDSVSKDGTCSPRITDKTLSEYLRLVCKTKNINMGKYCEDAIRLHIMEDIASDPELAKAIVAKIFSPKEEIKEEETEVQLTWL